MYPGFKDWWQGRADQARDFLDRGFLSDVVIGFDPITGTVEETSGGQGTMCDTSANCGSGFACINGFCQQIPAGTVDGTGEVSGPGSECSTEDSNSTGNACGSGLGEAVPTCSKPGCDNTNTLPDEGDEKTCGDKCCRFSANGVACFNGPCPYSGCSRFCTNYLAANGEVGAGCSDGPEGNSCDECTFCNVFGEGYGECLPRSEGFAQLDEPCWCKTAEGCSDCHRCDQEADSDDYGECVYAPETCQICSSISNYDCGCDIFLNGQYCSPLDSPIPPIWKLNASLKQRCEELCSDTCRPPLVETRWVEGTPEPPCPAGWCCEPNGTEEQAATAPVNEETCEYTYTNEFTTPITYGSGVQPGSNVRSTPTVVGNCYTGIVPEEFRQNPSDEMWDDKWAICEYSYPVLDCRNAIINEISHIVANPIESGENPVYPNDSPGTLSAPSNCEICDFNGTTWNLRTDKNCEAATGCKGEPFQCNCSADCADCFSCNEGFCEEDPGCADFNYCDSNPNGKTSYKSNALFVRASYNADTEVYELAGLKAMPIVTVFNLNNFDSAKGFTYQYACDNGETTFSEINCNCTSPQDCSNCPDSLWQFDQTETGACCDQACSDPEAGCADVTGDAAGPPIL